MLREQTVLRERLTKPLCQQNLPIHADLHRSDAFNVPLKEGGYHFNCIFVLITVYDCMYRYVVELMRMVVEFIQNMEEKIKMVQAIPKTDSYLSNLVSVCVCMLVRTKNI